VKATTYLNYEIRIMERSKDNVFCCYVLYKQH